MSSSSRPHIFVCVAIFPQILVPAFQFSERIQLSSPESRRKGVIVHNSLVDYKSISVVYDYKTSTEGQVKTAALLLRKALKSVPKAEIKEPLNIENLLEGEGEVPAIVQTFF